MKKIEVSQTSEPGGLGLESLANKGFAGPPYSLKGLDLTLCLRDETILIRFYDMSCSLNSGEKNYNELRKYI